MTRPLDTQSWVKRAKALWTAHQNKIATRPPHAPPPSDEAFQVLHALDLETTEDEWTGCDPETVIAGDEFTKGTGYYRLVCLDPPITLTTHYLARGDRPPPTRGPEGTDGHRRFYESALNADMARMRDLEAKIASLEDKLSARDARIGELNATVALRDARITALESKTTATEAPWYAPIADRGIAMFEKTAGLLETHITGDDQAKRFAQAQPLFADLLGAIQATGRPGYVVSRDEAVRGVVEELSNVLDMEEWLRANPPPESEAEEGSQAPEAKPKAPKPPKPAEHPAPKPTEGEVVEPKVEPGKVPPRTVIDTTLEEVKEDED